MKHFLLFQLYGAMSAWGDIAVGEERPSAIHPGRSAILGLLAAAVGIRRDEEDKHLALEHGYGMAVRMESSGTFLKDYHTTQVAPQVALKKHPAVTRRDELMALSSYQKQNQKISGTILSNRAYRCDALYQIVLWERQETSFPLAFLADRLNYPRFVLYLGRKSCPLSLPLQAHVVEAETLVEAYDQTKFISLKSFLKQIGAHKVGLSSDQTISLFWDEDEGVASGVQARETFIRRDKIFSRSRWQFEERRECHAVCQQQEG